MQPTLHPLRNRRCTYGGGYRRGWGRRGDRHLIIPARVQPRQDHRRDHRAGPGRDRILAEAKRGSALQHGRQPAQQSRGPVPGLRSGGQDGGAPGRRGGYGGDWHTPPDLRSDLRTAQPGQSGYRIPRA